MFTAYHPQNDGITEVFDRCLETYLRCMTSDKPYIYMWSKWLPLTKFRYNTNYHSSTIITPYEAVYGPLFGNSLGVPRTLGLGLAPNEKIEDFVGINRRFIFEYIWCIGEKSKEVHLV